jgi:hypothetical protein
MQAKTQNQLNYKCCWMWLEYRRIFIVTMTVEKLLSLQVQFTCCVEFRFILTRLSY